MLKDDILRLADRLDIREHYIQKLLDGTYKSLSVATIKPRRQVCLLAKLDQKHTPVIKITSDDDKEVINDMIELVRFFRLYRLEAKTQALKNKLLYDTNQIDKYNEKY